MRRSKGRVKNIFKKNCGQTMGICVYAWSIFLEIGQKQIKNRNYNSLKVK